ncbi:MAG: DUF3450 domain-containing protein [Gammaproteobacteria bacterium]|nr:DUF3450 domain-containing protein [Gammaproteobacteria bacterium]
MLFILMALFAGSTMAQTPAAAIDAVYELNSNALAAQKRIDQLYRQREQILADINTIEQEGSTFALRNRELETTIAEVNQSLAEIDADRQAVTGTQTGIIKLLRGMIDALENFIELDLPFELENRRAIVAKLRADLVGADISVTQKYQAVVSAYLNEVRFGHSNSVSQERIETPMGSRVVDVLRLGRAGLWFVTQDGTQAGRWDTHTRRWIDADTDPREVRSGIRVVRETSSSALVALPVQIEIP